MSTITDAVKKRKKEVGDEEVRRIVPVSLEEPEVEVPKANGARRVIGVVIVFLVVGAIGFGAVMLYKGLQRGKTPEESAGERVASLPGREVERLPLDVAREEGLPSAEKSPERSPAGAPEKPSETAPASAGAPGVVEARSPGVSRAPSAPKTVTTPVSDQQKPPATGVSTRPAEESRPPGAAGSVSSGPLPIRGAQGLPVPPAAQPADPFAGLVLQGIVRFDPKSPEALVNGKALKVGQSINGIEVVEIGADSVKLRCGAVEKVISY